MKNVAAILMLLLAPAGAAAQAASGRTETPTFDRIWQELTTWYDDASNPVVQRVLFTGRFHQDFNTIDAEQGDHDEWNTRRLRVGPRVTLFGDYTLHVEAELNPQEIDPLYVRLTDAYVQWSSSPRVVLTAGKHGMPFTIDGSTSSKELLTIDRSNLTNNMWFPQEYLPGLSVSGRISPWTYRAGIYSAGEANKEFGRFDGGLTTLAAVGYDFATPLGVSQAVLAGNYVYQNEDTDNTFTRQLEHVVSLSFRLETGSWGLRTDLSAADGYLQQNDLVGVMLMPYYSVTEKLQLIGRYTLVDSDGPNGVRLATYESSIVGARGDRYDELYLGANYLIYGHKLKLQTGLQLAEMDDRADDGGAYSGVSWTTGLRVGW